MTTPTFKAISEMTYTEAVSELEQIISTMQSDRCDIDLLSVYTRRATELLGECRRRLTATDEELRTILADFDAASPN